MDGTGGGRVPVGGFTAVLNDLKAFMTIPQDDVWPPDFADSSYGPHYNGLFIRLAWHCSGSYRESDGRGGCDGGRIRFDPEASWEDNANLKHALALLQTIKDKYGDALSWGDLIVLAGNAAIESAGGKTLGFCGGRIDDIDGGDSLKLGPSPEQEEIGPCETLDLQGKCLSVNGTALGPTTVGLIYVNAAGPINQTGDAVASGNDIRNSFVRMGFDDAITVALIGGGHTLGKMHGACKDPPCGNGMGNNTFTSGFEGSWTTNPTNWSNFYFHNLFNFDWTNITGPGGNLQWTPLKSDGSPGPNIAMLTTDIAMIKDEKYRVFSQSYATNLTAFEDDFAKAWYRLTSHDMGPSMRCIGDLLPQEPQAFQADLPVPPSTLPDYVPIRQKIQDLIVGNSSNINAFINLAYRCASTYRATDYRGGCNGARIRFSPEKDWPENEGTDTALSNLEAVKTAYTDISYADLIVLAGITALEYNKSDLKIAFCGGRVDADAGNANYSEALAPRYYEPPIITVTDDFQVKNLTVKEGVALYARENLSPDYFIKLIADAENNNTSSAKYTPEELALTDYVLDDIVQMFSTNSEALITTFVSGWTKLMNADRYANNYNNACDGVSTPTLESDTMPPSSPLSGSPPMSSPSGKSSAKSSSCYGIILICLSVVIMVVSSVF